MAQLHTGRQLVTLNGDGTEAIVVAAGLQPTQWLAVVMASRTCHTTNEMLESLSEDRRAQLVAT